MIFDDHRRAITTILGKRNRLGERTMEPTAVKPEVHMSEPGEGDGMHAAAQDILGAHNEKSPARLAESLRNFIDMHLHAMEGNKPEPKES